MLHYVILFLFLVIIVTLNPDVAFSPNVSNVKIHNDWSSNIDELVKANVNFIKELIDVRNAVKRVHIFDMQNIMCIIQELCVACYKPGLFSLFTSFISFSFFLFEFVFCIMVIMCE